jgi:hypothetical protein
VNALIGLCSTVWGDGTFAIYRNSRTIAAWLLSLIWIVNILSSRGMARWILRPWRASTNYGFRLLVLTLALAVAMDANSQSWTDRFGACWFLTEPNRSHGWHGEPTRLVTSIVTTLLVLAIVTPILINKKPVTGSSVSEETKNPSTALAAIWLLLNLLFVLSTTVQVLR